MGQHHHPGVLRYGKAYGEAAASAAVAFLISPIALPQLVMWAGNLLICAASALYTYLYRL